MKSAWLAFAVIFVAELGDKTQLAILALTGKGHSPWTVFLGSMLAFAILTGIAVLVGDWVQDRVPQNILSRVAALSFIGIGLFMWFGEA